MYDKDTFKKIIKVLNNDHTKINELNRASLINDIVEFFRADKLDYETTFEAIDYLRKEKKLFTNKISL